LADEDGRAAEAPRAELDLTEQEGEAPAQVPRPGAGVLVERPYDPEPARERVRGLLAQVLVGSVVVLAGATLVCVSAGWLDTSELERLDVIYTALITLTGTALGFYFGGRSGR
jgi:hypothetical protein